METDTLETFINGEIPVELPQGWHQTFVDMVFALKDYLDTNGIPAREMCFIQIKEKYGEMRIYFYFDDDNIGVDIKNTCYDIIEIYCHKTANICHQCGEHATYRSKDWILPWCNTCSDWHASVRERPKEILFTKISR